MMKRRRFRLSAGAGWLIAASALWVLARVVVEVVRISRNVDSRPDFALALIFSTAAAAIGTVALILGASSLVEWRTRSRHQALSRNEEFRWVFEVGKYPEVARALESVGAPPSLRRSSATSFFFSVALEDRCLSFWADSKPPIRAWQIELADIKSLGVGHVDFGIRRLQSIEVSVDGTVLLLPIFIPTAGKVSPASDDVFSGALELLKAARSSKGKTS